MCPTAGVPGMVGSLSSSSLVGEDSESLVTATMSLYICSISGVIRPWLMVRLFLARKERRWRDSTRLMEMSSCEMQAFGDVSASGCGRVVLRLPQKGSGKPVSRLRGREDVSLWGMEVMLLVSRVLQLEWRGARRGLRTETIFVQLDAQVVVIGEKREASRQQCVSLTPRQSGP